MNKLLQCIYFWTFETSIVNAVRQLAILEGPSLTSSSSYEKFAVVLTNEIFFNLVAQEGSMSHCLHTSQNIIEEEHPSAGDLGI